MFKDLASQPIKDKGAFLIEFGVFVERPENLECFFVRAVVTDGCHDDIVLICAKQGIGV